MPNRKALIILVAIMTLLILLGLVAFIYGVMQTAEQL